VSKRHVLKFPEILFQKKIENKGHIRRLHHLNFDTSGVFSSQVGVPFLLWSYMLDFGFVNAAAVWREQHAWV